MIITKIVAFANGATDYTLDNGLTLTAETTHYVPMITRVCQNNAVVWHCSTGVDTVPADLVSWIKRYQINPQCHVDYLSTGILQNMRRSNR